MLDLVPSGTSGVSMSTIKRGTAVPSSTYSFTKGIARVTLTRAPQATAFLVRRPRMMTGSIHYSSASPAVDIRKRFDKLARQWMRETAHLSSEDQIAKHVAYRQIVALGTPVVPLILQRVQRRQQYWFRALLDITGQNLASNANSFSEAADAWLDWGARNHLV